VFEQHVDRAKPDLGTTQMVGSQLAIPHQATPFQ
jgi:hypothetical protein